MRPVDGAAILLALCSCASAIKPNEPPPSDAPPPAAESARKKLKAPTPSSVPLAGLAEPPETSFETPQGAVLVPTSIERPADGSTVTDPNFPGVKLRILPKGLRHIYSQVQAWSTDMKYLVVGSPGSGDDMVIDATSFEQVVQLKGGSGWRWIPGEHAVLFYRGGNLMRIEVPSGTEHVILETKYPRLSANHSWEEITDSGNVAIYVKNDGSGGQHILVANVLDKTLRLDAPLDDFRDHEFPPDWVRVSPADDTLMIQWVGEGSGKGFGLALHDLDTKAFISTVYPHHGHADFRRTRDGGIMGVSSELNHPKNNNWPVIFLYDSKAPKRAVRMIEWNVFDHVSLTGRIGLPVASASTYVPKKPLAGEIYLIHGDGSLTRLAHHRSTNPEAYWNQSHASMAPDGRHVIFATNWGTGVEADSTSVIASF